MIALVASTVKAGTSTTVTTDSIDTTGASLLVAFVADYRDVTSTGSEVTDSKGNVYTELTRQVGIGIAAARLFYRANPTVGSGHTFTATAKTGDSFPGICVFAFSGVIIASPFDLEEGNDVSPGTSLQAGSVTPTENNEVLVAGVSFNATNTMSINGGFSTPIQQQYGAGTNFGAAASYLVQTTAAAADPTWSWGTSTDAAAVIASFKAAPAGGALRPFFTTIDATRIA